MWRQNIIHRSKENWMLFKLVMSRNFSVIELLGMSEQSRYDRYDKNTGHPKNAFHSNFSNQIRESKMFFRFPSRKVLHRVRIPLIERQGERTIWRWVDLVRNRHVSVCQWHCRWRRTNSIRLARVSPCCANHSHHCTRSPCSFEGIGPTRSKTISYFLSNRSYTLISDHNTEPSSVSSTPLCHRTHRRSHPYLCICHL